MNGCALTSAAPPPTAGRWAERLRRLASYISDDRYRPELLERPQPASQNGKVDLLNRTPATEWSYRRP